MPLGASPAQSESMLQTLLQKPWPPPPGEKQAKPWLHSPWAMVQTESWLPSLGSGVTVPPLPPPVPESAAVMPPSSSAVPPAPPPVPPVLPLAPPVLPVVPPLLPVVPPLLALMPPVPAEPPSAPPPPPPEQSQAPRVMVAWHTCVPVIDPHMQATDAPTAVPFGQGVAFLLLPHPTTTKASAPASIHAFHDCI